MPSEKLYGISPQPPETCPMIDEALSVVDACMSHLYRYEGMNEEQMRDSLRDIEWELSQLHSPRHRRHNKDNILEKIRENAAAIRSWGQEWKDLAKRYSNEINDLENTIKENKEEFWEYKKEIERLTEINAELKQGVDRAANSY
jgi:hypothetical protein